MLQKQPKTLVVWKMKVQLITVSLLDGLRNFTWVARNLIIRQDQVGLKLDSETTLEAVETNLSNSKKRESSKFNISQFSLVCDRIHSCWIIPYITKILQNFWFTQVVCKETKVFLKKFYAGANLKQFNKCILLNAFSKQIKFRSYNYWEYM